MKVLRGEGAIMRKEYPTVFISYSWDSEEHENWVVFLAAKLRENGVDATIDKFETQSKTVNLNRMMIEKIKNSDNITQRKQMLFRVG